jgi:hypothetical protein
MSDLEKSEDNQLENSANAIVTTKSKDYLLGYVDCLIMTKNSMGAERVNLQGNNIEMQQEQNEVLGAVYLDITCTCGFYIAYKNGNEIPEKSTLCPLCEKMYLIKYLDEKL